MSTTAPPAGQVTQTVTCPCGATTSLTGSPEFVGEAVWRFLSTHEQCCWAKRVAALAARQRAWGLFR